MFPPWAEGGALRAQDILTPGDPLSYGGSLLRLNPKTGGPARGNPLMGYPDLDYQRVSATGLRQPFRIAHRPGTDEIWFGDVGWSTWEEINRVQFPTFGTVPNNSQADVPIKVRMIFIFEKT